MKRWLALLSAVVGGAIAGLIVGSAIMLGLYSLLWVFVFGDNT